MLNEGCARWPLKIKMVIIYFFNWCINLFFFLPLSVSGGGHLTQLA